jgi:hypothetical protein
MPRRYFSNVYKDHKHYAINKPNKILLFLARILDKVFK